MGNDKKTSQTTVKTTANDSIKGISQLKPKQVSTSTNSGKKNG